MLYTNIYVNLLPLLFPHLSMLSYPSTAAVRWHLPAPSEHQFSPTLAIPYPNTRIDQHQSIRKLFTLAIDIVMFRSVRIALLTDVLIIILKLYLDFKYTFIIRASEASSDPRFWSGLVWSGCKCQPQVPACSTNSLTIYI
jgi:hypothetical protein